MAFMGAAAGTEPGKISAPVRSQRGAYLIQVISKSSPDSAGFEAQKQALQNQILQEKRNRFLSEWMEKLKADAKITDNREMLYR